MAAGSPALGDFVLCKSTSLHDQGAFASAPGPGWASDSLPRNCPTHRHIQCMLSPGMSEGLKGLKTKCVDNLDLAKGHCVKTIAVVVAEKTKSKHKQMRRGARRGRRGGSHLHVVLLSRTKSHGAYAKVKFT